MKSHRLLILLGVMIFLFCATAVMGYFVWIVLPERSQQHVFCTLQDEAYQALNNNYENWSRFFVLNYPQNDKEVMLTSDKGEQYLGRSIYNAQLTDDMHPFILMPREFPPNTAYGAAGYFYTPNGKLPQFDNYSLTQLTTNVYCYRIKS